MFEFLSCTCLSINHRKSHLHQLFLCLQVMLREDLFYLVSCSYCHLKATSVCLSKNKNLICGTHVSKQTIYLLVLFKRLTSRWYGYIMSAHLCSDVWENCNQKTAKGDCKLMRPQTQLKTQKSDLVTCLAYAGLSQLGGGRWYRGVAEELKKKEDNRNWKICDDSSRGS